MTPPCLPLEHAMIERIDSNRTDESPFGSTLTTPVDEDMILFHEIEQRLVEKSRVSHDDYNVEEDHAMIEKGGVDGHAMLNLVDQDPIKSAEDTTIQSIVPILERVESHIPSSDSMTRRAIRPRAQSIYMAGQKLLEQPNAYVLTDAPLPKDDPSSIMNMTKNISKEQELLGDIEEKISPSGLEAIPRETTHADIHFLSPTPIAEFDFDASYQLTSKLHTENDKYFQDPAETVKDFLALLPFAHQSPVLDTTHAIDYLSLAPQLSPSSIFLLFLRVLIFLPWCVIAGASILLFPQHLETIIFAPGFVASPEGIRRFAFWTEVSKELVSTFVASLIILWCSYPTVGLLVMGSTVVMFAYTWKGFRPDRKIPLGEDDMQSVYCVFKHYVSGDALVSMREEDDGFYL